MAAIATRAPIPMLLLALEALGALLIFVFIVWWTMFSGRKKGERKED
jgi:cbb3-type cytochrome oxidase subunit 3